MGFSDLKGKPFLELEGVFWLWVHGQQQKRLQTHQDLCSIYLPLSPDHRPGEKGMCTHDVEVQGLKGPRMTAGRVEIEKPGREPAGSIVLDHRGEETQFSVG